MKMGRRLRCRRSRIDSDRLPHLLAPCRRPILIATKYLVFRGQDTRSIHRLEYLGGGPQFNRLKAALLKYDRIVYIL